MATETLYADTTLVNSGCLTPANALNAPDGVFTTNTDNTNWTCNWGTTSPANPLTAGHTTHQATVRLRRSAAGGRDPTVQVDLYSGGVLVRNLVPAGTAIIGDAAQNFSANFSTSEIVDSTAIEMYVSATGFGGPTSGRRNVQVDAFTLAVDTTVPAPTSPVGSERPASWSALDSATSERGSAWDVLSDVTTATLPNIGNRIVQGGGVTYPPPHTATYSLSNLEVSNTARTYAVGQGYSEMEA
jgi:hypothetical protein